MISSNFFKIHLISSNKVQYQYCDNTAPIFEITLIGGLTFFSSALKVHKVGKMKIT